MDFYLSGSYNKEQMILDYAADTCCPVLASFAYPKIVDFRLMAMAERLRQSGKRVKFMLDSGAFTAWSSGVRIDREALVRRALSAQDEYSDVFDFTFVSLDEIPGSRWRETTAEDCASACKVSAENYAYMRRLVGDQVKPVFHTGDPEWLLDEYKDASVLGLGMNQNFSEGVRVAWVRRFNRKYPGRRLHGLAATGFSMLRAVPWHSVDSASWMYAASMGALNWLREDGRLVSVAISNKSPKLKEFNMHLVTLPDVYYEELRSKMAAVGLDIERAKDSGEVRQVWNAMQYRAACEFAAKSGPLPEEQGLFDA